MAGSETMTDAKPQRPTLNISLDVLLEVLSTIGSRKAESGGMLGGDGVDGDITSYYFDEGSKTSSVTYSPDAPKVNRLLADSWNPRGIRLRGFIHSHPGRMRVLSGGDELYGTRIMDACEDLEELHLPIINTFEDAGEFRMTSWVMVRHGDAKKIMPGSIKIVDADKHAIERFEAESGMKLPPMNEPLDMVRVSAELALSADRQGSPENKEVQVHVRTRKETDRDTTFDRVRKAYDLKHVAKCRVVAVGSGGAAQFLEEAARAGVGQFVLIDGDRVSETNLATQQAYRRDIGRLKVECVAERIRDINPSAIVCAVPRFLDALDDGLMERFLKGPIESEEPVRTVICGFTDNFEAQARVNRLALNFGVPSIAAQVYEEGRGAELTFTYPGETPACHRCMLASRYEFHAKNPGAAPVGSHGTPIWSTTRLNAIKGFVLLAILHHGTGHHRWGGWLKRIGNRTLIQVRLDPDIATTLQLPVFDRVYEGADKSRLFVDEVVWLPQEADSPKTGFPTCPECGGTGDLRNAIGKFNDTKVLKPSKQEAVDREGTRHLA